MVAEDDHSLPVPLPAVDRYWESKTESDNSIHQLAQRVLAIAVIAALLIVAGAFVFFATTKSEQNADHAATQAQISKLEAKVDCQNNAFNALFKDVPLLIAKDANPKDYEKAKLKC